MNNPTLTPITRASLLATASYNTRWFASLLAGTTVLGSAALATDWQGTTSTDWNVDSNWSGGAGTGGTNAFIGINSPVATISANIVATPVDILVGDGAGLNGRLDHLAGTAQTGGGNWMIVGRGGGTGVYNLAGSGTGGTFTGRSQGSGTMNVGGEIHIGQGGSSVGTVNVNTTGTLAMGSQLNLGRDGGTGTLNVDSGTVTNNNWLRVGAGNGGKGFLNISGGTVSKNGNDHLIIADNAGSEGTLTLTAGTLNVNNECWIGQAGGRAIINMSGGAINSNSWVAIGRDNVNSWGTLNQSGGTWTKTGGGVFIVGDNSKGEYFLSGTGALAVNGEIWVGQGGNGNGTMTMSAGTITNNSWVAIGRDNGTASFTMTGGSWTKTGGGQFIIGANGTSTMDMSGGLVDVQGGYTWVGEGNGRPATLSISGTAEFRTSTMSVGQNTNGTLNLNGGTIRTQRFIGSREADDTGASGGNCTINFNGTQVIATANNPVNFISTSVDNGIIGANGLLVNSNGFNIVAPNALSGTGGVVKSGAGTLTLSGATSYGGASSVQAGKLVVNGDSSGTGDITVANGAGLGVNQVDPANSLDPANVTFGTSGTLDINLGNVAGNPTAAPLNVTGTLTVGGPITVNVADQFPAVGSVPLISYVGPKGGAGSFVLGTLPNGVVGNLVDNGTGLVSLNVTSVALPRWDGTNESGLTKTGDTVDFSSDITVTDASGITIGQFVRGPGIPPATTVTNISGQTITLSNTVVGSATGVNFLFVTTAGTNEGVWDFVTENWFDLVTNASSLYADPAPVLFDDNATGPTAVTLNTTVAPSAVTFNNSTLTYSLSGTGNVTGTTGLTKSGAGALTLGTTNDYTGVTRLEGGTTSVSTLSNGGVASSIGAAPAATGNIVLAGGTLAYTGSAVTIDRGLSIAAANAGTVSTLNLASDVTTSGQISASLGKLFKTGPGTLTLTGSGANILANGDASETRALSIVEGGLVLNGVGQTNSVTGRIATGTVEGASASLTLANGASLTIDGESNISTAANTTSTLTISGSSVYQANNIVQLGLAAGSVTNVVVEDSGSFNKGTGGWMSIGNSSTAVTTFTIRDSGSLTSGGGDMNIGDVDSANGTLILEDDATVTSAGFVFIGKNSTTGAVFMSGTSNMSCPETDVGYGNPSVGTLTIGRDGVLADTPVYTQTGRLLVGRDGGSTGTLTIQGSGSMTVGSYTSVGMGGQGTMVVKDSGSFSNTDDFSVCENGDDPAVVTVEDNGTLSAGTNGGGATLYVGRNDNKVGTLNIQGAATVSAGGSGGVRLAAGAGSIGTVNLDGGTLVTRQVTAGGGTSILHLNGGVLKAGTGAALNFISGVDTLDVGGASVIDSNGQTIAINQGIGENNGTLTKQGAGTLQLNAASSYLGVTTVAAGTLGGAGSIQGPLVVQAGASIAPGAGDIGTFVVEDILGDGSSVAGTYVCEISGATTDQLAVAGPLNIPVGATLDFNVLATPAAGTYVIASYGSVSGTFNVVDLPSGATLNYGATELTLTLTGTPYSLWAQSYGLDPLTDGDPAFDKDGDGQVNSVEFALGGSPISGTDNAKVYHLASDSDVDGDASRESVLTIAVRTGTPAFTGSPSPTATQDGYTYAIQGSTTLGTFTTAVTPTTTAVTTGLPAAPTGYEYRSFSLSGSNGLPAKGFLRVLVTP